MARYRRDIFRLLEAAFVGLFFVQTVRFLYGTLYAHLGSANLVNVTSDPSTLVGMPGVVNPADLQIELVVTGIALLAPILSVIFGRVWFGPAVAAIIVAAGRVFITANGGTFLGVVGAAAALGGALLYLTTITIRRPGLVPVCLVLGFAADQMIRLYGSTADVTWRGDFLPTQTVISLALFVIAVLTTVFERVGITPEDAPPPKGEISGWSAFALGGLLYLEFAVYGLPNTIAHRAGVDYIVVGPWLVVATLLPLVAEVRELTRRFLNMFDGQYRGWVWFLMIGLLTVIGFRFSGALAAGALILAQLLISLSWWWVVQPSGGKRNFSAIGVIIGVLLFLLLTGGDFFTFEYAFVRGVQEPLGSILRAFRGLGLAVVLFAILISGLPAILARKRLPWHGGRISESLAGLALVVGAGVLAGSLSRPIVASPTASNDQLRIASFNLRSGYGMYFASDLAEVEQQIRAYGVDILLLQEVEAGRLISFGVDQPAWLARQLNMQVEYFPTNEGLQGLAILTRLPIQQSVGSLLSGVGRQTGVQFVRLRAPDQNDLDVYNTQLGLLIRNQDQTVEGEQEQIQQLKEMLGFINQNGSADATSRTMVGGTFNNVPTSDIYQYMATSFVDPLAGLQAEKAVTLKLVNGSAARVDYLWLRNITSRFVGAPPMPHWNHNLVVVEIGLLQSTG